MAEQSYWIQPACAIAKQDIRLPATDQISLRTHVPIVLCFTTDASFSVEKFTVALKAAIAAMLVEMPFLAGQIARESKDKSRLKISFPEVPTVLLRFNHLRHQDAESMQASSWPPYALGPTEVCPPGDRWNPIGPCFSMQANFIKGGLIFVSLINHIVADGITMMDILRVLGKHLKAFEHGSKSPSLQTIDSTALRRSLVFGTPTKKTLTDWKDYRTANQSKIEENQERFKVKSGELGFTYWHISPEKMCRLRAAIQSPHSQDEDLSFTCCLSAFLWRVLTRARNLDETTMTTFLLSIQVRERVRPHLPREYCGNPLVYSRARASVAELSSESLASLGLRIKRSISWWTPERIREYWGSVDNCQKLDQIALNKDLHAADLELSSLMNAPLWETDWGNGLRLSAQRGPDFPFIDGFIMVLPRLPSGGLEVVLHLAKATLQTLVQDAEFRGYMDYRCGTDPDLTLPSMT